MRKSKKTEFVLSEPHHDHRWKIEEVVGCTGEALIYAECAQLPNYTRKGKLPLVITFYDLALKGPDVLENLLVCTRSVGDTVISRLLGDGTPVSRFTFVNSVVEELVMPKLDYKSGEISRIVVRISYDKVLYRSILRKG